MIDKDSIIQQSLMKIGQIQGYNDNKSQIYKIASSLLERLVKYIATSKAYLFNATTIKPNKTGNKSFQDETEYNRPIDLLNLLQANAKYRLEGEFIYSDSDELVIQYMRDLPLIEFPDYLEKLMIYELSLQLCENFPQYEKKLSLMNQRVAEARAEIMCIEGLPNRFTAGGR